MVETGSSEACIHTVCGLPMRLAARKQNAAGNVSCMDPASADRADFLYACCSDAVGGCPLIRRNMAYYISGLNLYCHILPFWPSKGLPFNSPMPRLVDSKGLGSRLAQPPRRPRAKVHAASTGAKVGKAALVKEYCLCKTELSPYKGILLHRA